MSTNVTDMLDIFESVEQSYNNEDSEINVDLNNSDPYRGNSLAIGSINNISYIFFPGGDSLCHLGIFDI